MKKIALLLPVLVVLLGATACGTKVTSNNPNTIVMNGSVFARSSITIKKGSTIAFLDDPDNGGTHFLVTGKDGEEHGEKGTPDFGGLSGHRTTAGDLWTTGAWNTAGTFHVTCTVHPAMNLVVTVTD